MPKTGLHATRRATIETRFHDFLKRDPHIEVELTGRFTSLLSEIVKARAAIEKKAQEVGDTIGAPKGQATDGAGDGYTGLYDNGIIYLLPPGAPCWVHGAILGEYLSIGAEGGVLGYPITDELSTAGGSGRFNHFEHGSIYWSPATGAHEVHGAIRDKWASLGWEASWLGFPVSDERPFPDGGRFSLFEHGGIYWWPDTGAIALGSVVVRYKGLYCFGETDEASDADEPYVLFGVTPIPPAQAFSVRSRIYDDVDSGNSRPDELELYRGVPAGMALGLVLWEHDDGDPDKYLGLVKDGASLAGKGIAAACGALFGPEAAAPCEGAWKAVAPLIVESVNGLLGTADDEIARWTRPISAKEMVTTAGRPRQNFWGIEYHFESNLLTDGDASYKVYFDIEPLIPIG